MASGKKRASPATVLAFCAARPVAVACCAKRMRNPLPRLVLPDQNAVGLPLFPVRKSCGEPESAVQKRKSNAATNAENGRTSTEVNAVSEG